MSHAVHGAPMQWTHERIAAFWDFQSRFFETYFANRHGPALAALLARFVAPPASVLDYGSGPGFLLPHLLRAGFRVTACDISPDSLAVARQAGGPFPNFAGAFLTDDPALRAGRFDAALMTELVEHVDDPTLDAILASVKTLLPRDAVLLVTTPNDEDLAAETVFCPCCGSTFHRWQHVRSWSEQALNRRLVEAGFRPLASGTWDAALHVPHASWRVRLARLRARVAGRKAPHLWSAVRAPG